MIIIKFTNESVRSRDVCEFFASVLDDKTDTPRKMKSRTLCELKYWGKISMWSMGEELKSSMSGETMKMLIALNV